MIQGVFFWFHPTEKMTKYTGPTQNTKGDRVFNNWENAVICCVLGGTSVVKSFFCWGGTVPYLELFWRDQSKVYFETIPDFFESIGYTST